MLKAELHNGTEYSSNAVSYVIRLKANNVLYNNSKYLDAEILEAMKKDATRYIVRYDDYYYKATKWNYPRRVVKGGNANQLGLHVLAY